MANRREGLGQAGQTNRCEGFGRLGLANRSDGFGLHNTEFARQSLEVDGLEDQEGLQTSQELQSGQCVEITPSYALAIDCDPELALANYLAG